MKNTPEKLAALASETALALTTGKWPDFLHTAAWMHQFSFADQLLILAQKPNATACAPYEVWASEPYERIPRKGTAITLPDGSNHKAGLRYVFDISDTFVKRGVKSPSNPVRHITPEEESDIRRTLAEKYLPSIQHSEAHLSSAPDYFYRSVAFELVSQHRDEIRNRVENVRHTCALHMFPDVEIARILQNLLTESLSAMLQHRCGLEPTVREEHLSHVQYFDSPESISILGHALHLISAEILAELSHTTPLGQAHFKQKASQIASEGREGEGEYLSSSEGETPANRLKTPFKGLDPNSSFQLGTEDLIRIIQEGPPLEGGKFRLQAAAQNPNITLEELAELLRKEYGTGQRPFRLDCGASGNLLYGPSGFVLAHADLSGVSPLTATWERVTAHLKRLVEENSYLTPSEQNHMADYFAMQEALQGRQRVGAAIWTLLQMFEPDRSTLARSQERVRAYAHENSEPDRQALSGRLLALLVQPRVQSDSVAYETIQMLLGILANRGEDRSTLQPSNIPSPTHGANERAKGKNASPHSPNAYKGVSLYTDFLRQNSCTPLYKPPVKDFPLTDFPGVSEAFLTQNHSVHTLRVAISALLNAQYVSYLDELKDAERRALPSAERLGMILSDYTKESSLYAAEQIPFAVEDALRTSDHISGTLMSLAFQMRQSPREEVSRAGSAALQLFEMLYRTDENGLKRLAQSSGFLQDRSNPPPQSTTALPLGPMDAVRLDGQTYDVHLCKDGQIQLISQATGEILPYTDVEQLSIRIRSQVDNRLIPAWSRDIGCHLYQRDDQQILSDLLRHFGTWSSCESICVPGESYRTLQDHLLNLRVSEDPAINRKQILQVAQAIHRFFPNPDPLSERGWETTRLLSRAEDYLNLHPRPFRPDLDHPELLRMDPSRLDRRDKVVLTDLLHHFGTYQCTFKLNTPELSPNDSRLREEQMQQMDEMRVSDSIEENLKQIQTAKTILNRWFLPFEGIHPDILEQQEILLSNADLILLDPPNSAPVHTHTHTHTHTHNQSLVSQGLAQHEANEKSIPSHHSQVGNLSRGEGEIDVETPLPLEHRIQLAQARAFSSHPIGGELYSIQI